MFRGLAVLSLSTLTACAAPEPRFATASETVERAAVSDPSAQPSSRAPQATVAPNAAPETHLASPQLSIFPNVATEAPSSSEPSTLPNPSLPNVESEVPYPLGERPLPADPVNASAHDTVLGAWNQGGSSDPSQPWNRAGFHPATRVILDTKLLSSKKALGKLTAASILAQTRAQSYWPFRLCFEEALRRGGERSGTAVLRFSIDTRGRVSFARKMKSQVDTEVANCWRKAAYTPKYQPAPARRVDVELTAQVSKGDVTLPGRDPKPERVAPSASLVPESKARTADVAQCYSRGLARDPMLWGRIELQLTIDADGIVTEANELGSRFLDAEVTNCVKELFVGASFATERSRDWVVAFKLGQYVPP